MNVSQSTQIAFYQNLGKLFYAIAAADAIVRKEELDILKEVLKKEWVTTNFIKGDLKINTEDLIIDTFNWLHMDNEYDAEICYQSFVSFMNEHKSLFTHDINALIIKTARAVAASFSRVNKSELIMLTKLTIELKNINDEK